MRPQPIRHGFTLVELLVLIDPGRRAGRIPGDRLDVEHAFQRSASWRRERSSPRWRVRFLADETTMQTLAQLAIRDDGGQLAEF
jgi:hypothetical protein